MQSLLKCRLKNIEKVQFVFKYCKLYKISKPVPVIDFVTMCLTSFASSERLFSFGQIINSCPFQEKRKVKLCLQNTVANGFYSFQHIADTQCLCIYLWV